MPKHFRTKLADAYDDKAALVDLLAEIDTAKRPIKPQVAIAAADMNLEHAKRQEKVRKLKKKESDLKTIRAEVNIRIIELNRPLSPITPKAEPKGFAKLFTKDYDEKTNTYLMYYENEMFVGNIYQEVHGEWVIVLDKTGGYTSAYHLHGIAEHLDELNG